MTAEITSEAIDLNEETRAMWNQKASFWDERMGDGNDFHRLLVSPAAERLLNLQPGETVLEIACGNGVFSRRMAQLKNEVLRRDAVAPIAYVHSGGYRGMPARAHECRASANRSYWSVSPAGAP